MKIVVTGANGMLGNTLCQLYNNGHKVFAFHRDNKCFAPSSSDFLIELTNIEEIRNIFRHISPDIVIHCAGMTDLEKCEIHSEKAYETNSTITENIAKTCTEKTKLIYISTDQVYGESNDHSEINEEIKPLNEYGKSKLDGEYKVNKYNNNYIIIRTNIFGWNVKSGRISSAEWIYYSLKQGQNITLFNDYIFSPIYTKYLGIIILYLIKNEYTGLINVGSQVPCSKYEFGMGISNIFEFDQTLINKGSLEAHKFVANRCKNMVLNCNKIAKFNINIPDWKKSIEMFMTDKLHN